MSAEAAAILAGAAGNFANTLAGAAAVLAGGMVLSAIIFFVTFLYLVNNT